MVARRAGSRAKEVDRVRERLPVARRDELALHPGADEFRDAGEVRCDDREALARRLEQHVRQAVAVAGGRLLGRQHEEVRLLQELSRLRLGLRAEEGNPARNGAASGARLELLEKLAAADMGEAPVQIGG